MKQKILEATNGGLDVILYYYPEANGCVGNNKKFKARDEHTASATIKEYNGVWYMTDYGVSQKGCNCFDVCMEREGFTFAESLAVLAERYNVDCRLKKGVNEPAIKYRNAKEGEEDGQWTWKEKKAPSGDDMKALSSWMKATDIMDLMDKYHIVALECYTQTFISDKTNMLTTKIVQSHENFPIFLFNYGDFQKIACPRAWDKSQRFRYPNGRASNFICGLEQIKNAYAAMNKDDELDELKERDSSKPRKPKKLSEIIICSGERDAFNCAGMGFYPVWFNSETEDFGDEQMHILSKYAERVINIPDLDTTGIKKGMEKSLACWDLYTVILPERLKTFKDNRGKPCKDLNDWCHFRHGNRKEFRELLNNAKRCQFWEEYISRDKRKYEINTINLLWYLRCLGFYKIEETKSNQEVLVRIEDYIVHKVTAKQIRGLIKRELDRLNKPVDIQRLFQDSKKCGNALMEDLSGVEIDFTKSTADSRTFFFLNKAITVTADGITEIRKEDVKAKTWEENISPHNWTRLEPTIWFNKDNQYDWSRNTTSNYMRVMINSSRMYWREELELRVTGNVEEDAAYALQHKFDLCGPRLTDDEQMEQLEHFFAKCYALGYLLHQYKTKSNAKALWILENRLTEVNESAGGSGKSFFVEMLQKFGMLNVTTLSGREKALTDNKHVLDRVDKWTEILYIDDADVKFDFDYFYTTITGNMIINPKGEKSYEIDYHDSPILAFSSNHPPQRGNDRSTLRRLLMVVYSDYYHEKGKGDLYRETRKISDDIGGDVGERDYTEAQYNADINFLIDCEQFYLKCLQLKYQPQPPMENVFKRINMAEMGNSGFEDWADAYFSDESENTDCLIRRDIAFGDFKNSTDNRQWSPQKFSKALNAYVENHADRIVCLNPKEVLKGNRRIIRRIGNKAHECLYIQTVGKSINDTVKPGHNI